MRTRRAGFTLLEMLVVVSIIVILIGLVVAGGAALIGNRKAIVTESLLLSLDRALEDYMAANQNTIPPFIPMDYSRAPGDDVVAADDAMRANPAPNGVDIASPSNDIAYSDFEDTIYPRYPDASVFIRQVRGYGDVDAILEGLGEQWLTPTPILIDATSGSGDPQESDVTPSVRDAWSGDGWTGGRDDGPSWPVLDPEAGLIFYVHPQNLLAQELYGRTVNRRPYFFSAGADLLYGVTNQISPGGALTGERNTSDAAIEQAISALEDNLYSYEVGPANTSEPTTGGSFTREYR